MCLKWSVDARLLIGIPVIYRMTTTWSVIAHCQQIPSTYIFIRQNAIQLTSNISYILTFGLCWDIFSREVLEIWCYYSWLFSSIPDTSIGPTSFDPSMFQPPTTSSMDSPSAMGMDDPNKHKIKKKKKKNKHRHKHKLKKDRPDRDSQPGRPLGLDMPLSSDTSNANSPMVQDNAPSSPEFEVI